MALLDILAGELLGPKSVGEISKSTGASNEQVTQLVTSALPLLLSGMYQNSATAEGAQSLDQALNDHAPDAEKSTSAMLRKADPKDGKKILSHILGDNEKEITKGLSKSTGLTQTQVTGSLSLLAPVLLSLVGNHKNETGKTQSAAPSLASLLGTALLGNSYQDTKPAQQSGLNLMSLAGSLLGSSVQTQQPDAKQKTTAKKTTGTKTTTAKTSGTKKATTAKTTGTKKTTTKQAAEPEPQPQSNGINLSGLLLSLLK